MYCCVKDVLLTLTDCLVSNSLTLVAIKKLFSAGALVDYDIDVSIHGMNAGFK